MKEKWKQVLKKQHYLIVGNNGAVQVCRWTKKSLRDEGVCWKEKFYGIKSHLCCQMSPCVMNCQNSCLHCWRAIEFNQGEKIKKVDKPKKIIEGCIEAQRKLLSGFKGSKKTNLKKFKEAQNPKHFAISLSGEPTLYPKLDKLILELRKQRKTSFLVTNGLLPEKLLELKKKNALPTQLVISTNAPNEKLFKIWHRNSKKNAWKKFNRSLEIMKKLKKRTRRVIRLTLVKEGKKLLSNMKDENIFEYARLIKKAEPDFIHVKGYMSIGFARKRLGYDRMPTHEEIRDFSKKLLKYLKSEKYKFLDEEIYSRVVLLGKSRVKMKIKEGEI